VELAEWKFHYWNAVIKFHRHISSPPPPTVCTSSQKNQPHVLPALPVLQMATERAFKWWFRHEKIHSVVPGTCALTSHNNGEPSGIQGSATWRDVTWRDAQGVILGTWYSSLPEWLRHKHMGKAAGTYNSLQRRRILGKHFKPTATPSLCVQGQQ
jgi:hypothetical protein